MLRREWADFSYPADPSWTWRVDISLLTSGFGCIYMQGCPGILPDQPPAHGCCRYSFNFFYKDMNNLDLTDEEDVAKTVPLLTDEEWQFKKVGEKRWWAKSGRAWPGGRVYKGACVFLNRPGWTLKDGTPAEGCAFHVAAMRRGESFVDWKPMSCWMVPLYVECDYDDSVYILRQYDRADWGETELSWWCADESIAHANPVPLYKRLEQELRYLMTDEVFEQVRLYIEEHHPYHVDCDTMPKPVPVTIRSSREAPTSPSEPLEGAV